MIFWDLGKKEEPNPNSSMYKEVVVEEFDEHACLMSRIWNEFMNEPEQNDSSISNNSCYEKLNATPSMIY